MRQLAFPVLAALLSASVAAAETQTVECRHSTGSRYQNGARKAAPKLHDKSVLTVESGVGGTWYVAESDRTLSPRDLVQVSSSPTATSWTSTEGGGAWLITRFKRTGRAIFVHSHDGNQATTDIYFARCRVLSLPMRPSRAGIKRAMRGRQAAVKKCGVHTGDRRIVKARLLVGPAGRATSVSVNPPDALGRCVTQALQDLRFPASSLGVEFTYPFSF